MSQGGEPNPSIRASDADRERVVEILRQHTAEGRLTAEEFEERMTAAYAARTMGALAELTTDLPVDLAEHARRQSELARVAKPRNTPARQFREEITGIIGLALILSTIWLIAGAGYYWPAWPLGVMLAITLAKALRAWGGS